MHTWISCVSDAPTPLFLHRCLKTNKLACKGLLSNKGSWSSRLLKSISFTDRTDLNENRPWWWATMLPWQQAGWACSLALVSSGVRQAAPRRFGFLTSLVEESKLQSQMGSWENGRGVAWVRVRCMSGVGGNYKVRHKINLCLRAQTWEMKKVVGVFFCYHPNPAMANYRDIWEGQTNRLTHSRTHTPTHTRPHTQKTAIYSQHNYKHTGKSTRDSHSLYLTQTSEHTTTAVKTHCMQIKEAALRVKREQDGYNNRNSVGSQRNTPATTDCWHMNTHRWVG